MFGSLFRIFRMTTLARAKPCLRCSHQMLSNAMNLFCRHPPSMTYTDYNTVQENGYHAANREVVVPTTNSFTSRLPTSEIAVENCICKNLYKSKEISGKMSDRLGQWGTESDSEISGNLSGFQRLHNGRYNKVSNLIYFHTYSKFFIQINTQSDDATNDKVVVVWDNLFQWNLNLNLYLFEYLPENNNRCTVIVNEERGNEEELNWLVHLYNLSRVTLTLEGHTCSIQLTLSWMFEMFISFSLVHRASA